MTDYGIDVSSFNTVTDWSAVKSAGNTWAWSKATQGSGYTNSLFASQMVSGRHAGLRMGAYHFPDPRISVATQVRYFVSVAKPCGAFADGAMLPMLDMENSAADGIVWSASGANTFIPAFRDALRAAAGVQPLCVYAPESWWSGGFLNPGLWADGNVVLCAAQYTGQPGQLGWSHPRLAVHQYTDSAPTPGATAPTDRSVILAPYSLPQLTIGGTVSPNILKEDDMAGFWFIGNQATGDVALLYPNGDFVGASGSNWAAVTQANNVPKLDVPQQAWDDMRTRHANDRQALAQAIADALKADGIGTGAGGTTNVTNAFPNHWTSKDNGDGTSTYTGTTV